MKVPTSIDVLNGGEIMLNYKGIVHFENLYKMMFDWLNQRGYRYPGTGDENIEDYYGETILSGGAVKNAWILWRAEKEDGFFLYQLEIDFQILVMGTKEIVYNDQKIKMNEGEFSLMIRAKMLFDKAELWTKKDSLAKKILPWVYENQMHKVFEEKEADLHGQAHELMERVRQFIGLPTSRPLTRTYHPEGGYPQQPETVKP
ncbi:MAG TPA: hypothetical protein VK158_05935 [Acidobacteriota bacterium]|nr:hypothetical protein [Acidobacteriota bacterium]